MGLTIPISPSKSLPPSDIWRSWPRFNPVFNTHSFAVPLKFSTFSYLSPKIPKSARTTNSATSFRVSAIPARDIFIDFGKFKGKMLGSLPSTYLKWVSKNLRAGDMEEWAKLADEVLEDPVYKDRIEWEAAEKILNGDTASHCSKGNGRNAVTELLEISERFGWDNEDKSGWSKIDFGLLGTSKGGRIPRVVAGRSDAEVGNLWENNEAGEGGGRRRVRGERVRRLKQKTNNVTCGWATERTVDRRLEEEGEGGSSSPADGVVRSPCPFPGREALLNKVLNRRIL